MTDEYNAIEPIATEVNFRGAKRHITPLKVGQLPKFARAIKGIGADGLAALETGDVAGIFDLIAVHGEQIIEAASVASNIERKEIEEADSDELLLLIAAVMRVNADFFARRLLPTIKAQAQAMNGAGLTQSTP